MGSDTPPSEPFRLLETMAYLPLTGLRNEAAHLERLIASAHYFGFRLELQEIRARLQDALAAERRPRRVRLAARRDGAISVELDPMPRRSTRPVRLVVDADPVSSQSIWLLHKTTRRETYDARAARHQYADDVVLVNEHGQVTESTTANLAVRINGTWVTPPVECGCLPGVERSRLVRERRLTEHVLKVADLHGSEGLALVSSLRGWRSASLVA